MKYLWGIDLGGTKVEGVVLKYHDDHPQVISRLRVPTESAKGYHHILDQISLCVELLTKDSGLIPESIGIGTPGTLDPISSTLKNSNTVCMNGKPLLGDLQSRFNLNLRMANDANCFALAEQKFGVVNQKMPKAKVIFGTIMGTGVGGGLVINGEIISGRQGIGGEWGHNFLDESGGRCYCGKTGCVECIISGPALERFYTKLSGQQKFLKNIVQAARDGTDVHAQEILKRLLEMFGKAIAVVINIVDPDAIVLGGGLGNIEELYAEGVREVEKHVFNNRLETVFLKPTLGDSAGVFGAALLCQSG